MNAFIITTLAGLSTVLGSFLIFLKRKPETILNKSLSFASGVMFSISIFDLIPTSYEMISKTYYLIPTILLVAIFFLIGMIFSIAIDKYLPQEKKHLDSKLYTVGIISCIAIILHNIPEGIITYITSSQNLKLGIHLAIAIALHNIPEGISISVPIYYSTKNKKKAFTYTILSGMSEPLGALIAYFFLAPFVTDFIMGILYAIIGGIMIQISTQELLPQALSYKKRKETILFFLLGSGFMIVQHFIFG